MRVYLLNIDINHHFFILFYLILSIKALNVKSYANYFFSNHTKKVISETKYFNSDFFLSVTVVLV